MSDDVDDRDDRSSRRDSGNAKQGSNSTLFIILGVVGGVLLLCCGGGIFGVVYVTNKTAEAAKDIARKFEEEMKKQEALAKAQKDKFEIEEKVIGKLILDQNDRINPNDPLIDVKSGPGMAEKRKAKTFNVQFTQGKIYVINMKQNQGTQSDPYLILNDAKGDFAASDDDGGGFPHARITHVAGMSGQYRIFATFLGDKSGEFKLSVEER